MDPSLNLEPEENPVCASCGKPEIIKGFPVKLCAECRSRFIKYPIPLWVKLFGLGVAIIMLISVIWVPRNLQAAIHLSRAESAEKNKNYLTEQRELEKAKQNVPNAIDILGHLIIASFYNSDIKTLQDSYQSLDNKIVEDSTLLNNINYVTGEFKSYYPSEVFDTAFIKYKKSIIPDSALRRYIKKNPMDVFANYSLASSYADKEKYNETDSLLSATLNIQPSFIPAMNLKAMVKRELNQLDSSIYYCNKLMDMNHESVYALSCKGRTFLKEGNYKEGLKLARQAFDLDNTDPYNLATLAIAYHLNKDYKQRDILVSLSEKDSVSRSYMKFAKDIISGKIKY